MCFKYTRKLKVRAHYGMGNHKKSTMHTHEHYTIEKKMKRLRVCAHGSLQKSLRILSPSAIMRWNLQFMRERENTWQSGAQWGSIVVRGAADYDVLLNYLNHYSQINYQQLTCTNKTATTLSVSRTVIFEYEKEHFVASPLFGNE